MASSTDRLDEPRAYAASGPLDLEHGLICGFQFGAGRPPSTVDLAGVGRAVHDPDSVVWLHFNANHAAARRWLARSGLVPDEFMQFIHEHEARVRFEFESGGLLGVLTDVAFNADNFDPSEAVTVWFFASPRLIVTARDHAAHTTDRLRQEARTSLTIADGTAFVQRFLQIQVDALILWLAQAAQRVDHAEDQILIGNVSEQRESLGRIRRLAMHVRRRFSPHRSALQKALGGNRLASVGADIDEWRTLADDFVFAMDEAANIYERTKVLQEELSSMLAETTSRNLYVLTICTLVFLPMTLITGIFGMNVNGLPGAGEHASPVAFWWVAILMLFAGAAALLLLRLRRFF